MLEIESTGFRYESGFTFHVNYVQLDYDWHLVHVGGTL